MKTCAFTGHRPQNLSFGFNENDLRCIKLKKVLNYLIRETIEKCGVAHFFTGMALGTDIFAAEEIICLKKQISVYHSYRRFALRRPDFEME